MEPTSRDFLLELWKVNTKEELQSWCGQLKLSGATGSCSCGQVASFVHRRGQGIEPYYWILKRLQEAYYITEDEEVRSKIEKMMDGMDLERFREKHFLTGMAAAMTG